MSIKATYADGVFRPIERVRAGTPGEIFTVFSDEELEDLRQTLGWLKSSEKSFEFWNNEQDAIYDNL